MGIENPVVTARPEDLVRAFGAPRRDGSFVLRIPAMTKKVLVGAQYNMYRRQYLPVEVTVPYHAELCLLPGQMRCLGVRVKWEVVGLTGNVLEHALAWIRDRVQSQKRYYVSKKSSQTTAPRRLRRATMPY
jgi:hypothetical protein